MDDESGWNAVLLEVWSDAVRDAVLDRIDEAMVGRRGWLVRVFAAPDAARPELTETVHAVVLAAIRDETGADLESLGSQAAWECYEQVWDGLGERWRDGGRTLPVPLGREPAVTRLLGELPPEVAVAAGADLVGGRPDPLWLAGRLRVDADGLTACLSDGPAAFPAAARGRIQALLVALDLEA